MEKRFDYFRVIHLQPEDPVIVFVYEVVDSEHTHEHVLAGPSAKYILNQCMEQIVHDKNNDGFMSFNDSLCKVLKEFVLDRGLGVS